jgi:hypothetical protein
MRNAWRLGDWLEETVIQSDVWCDVWFLIFVVTKYTTFILLLRCHPWMDFDIGHREHIYCVHTTDQFVSSMLVLFSWMLV